ncbi:hypothetical protein MMC14_000265 [Varicellaria rhodocarpa]|nr:hypothetical protein [Varicellaria rhodocarpa]
MNDPSFETNSKSKGKSIDEADTCRICRGEGSKEEPLFYPCKCSGSIKFVHQACLMEWLSHSQKKHCELCKTSFRFTKLYDPKMPSSVPVPVFLRQAMVHTLKSLVTWARWHLVAFVWLGWVPWCMRTVWRGLFWIGDGGWVDWQEMERQSSSTTQRQLEELASVNATLAGRELPLTTNATPQDFVSWIFKVATPSSPVSQTLNFTAGDPTLYKLAKRLFHGIIYHNSVGIASTNSTLPNPAKGHGSSQRSPSWLSEMRFLQSLTPWTTINNLVIDVFEGQIITLFVCVAFILIFLIREWVVQQQPGINMVAAANALVPAERRRDPVEQEGAQLHEQRARALARDLPPAEDSVVERQDDTTRPSNPTTRARSRSMPISTTGEDKTIGNRPAPGELSMRGAVEVDANESIFGPFHPAIEAIDSTAEAGPSSPGQRPSLPTRDALAKATEIQRTLEEGSGSSSRDWPALDVFMDLWKRGNNNPSDVLKIINEEGRRKELSWIVSVMEKVEKAQMERSVGDEDSTLNSSVNKVDEDPSGEHHSDASNESWQDVPGPLDQSSFDLLGTVQENAKPKRKSKEIPVPPIESPSLLPTGNPSDLESENLANDERIDKGKAKEMLDPITLPTHATSNIDDEINKQMTNIVDEHQIDDIARTITLHMAEDLNPNQGVVSRKNTKSFASLDFPKSQLGEKSSFVNDSVSKVALAALDKSEGPNAVGQKPSPPVDTDTQAGLDNSQSSRAPQQNRQAVGPSEVQDVVNAPQDLSENVMDWLWGGITEVATPATDRGEDDERVVDNVANEAPFVPMVNGQLMIEDGNAIENAGQDPEVVRAAAEAGLNLNEQEVVEDGEDLEGIMELIGMQGPLAGLVQNGMFSAVLISMTVFFGIWVPYVTGKVFLVLLANPISLLIKLPLRWASIFADVTIDTCVFITACVIYWVDTFRRLLSTPLGWMVPFIARMNESKLVAEKARTFAQNALERLAKLFVASGDSLSDSDVPIFSIVAHESLRTIEDHLKDTMKFMMGIMIAFCERLSSNGFNATSAFKSTRHAILVLAHGFTASITQRVQQILMIVPAISRINPLRINLDIPQRAHPLDYSLAQWNTKDRIFAIILGYLAFSIIGALYLKAKATLREGRNGEKLEGAAAEALLQAGGVMKVILIISIEMIVFPLYCGLLLDVALLPLFENASTTSRLQFAINSPSTSLFVHWFVGTCYMFHFALFVAMCRKIMRSGVLCKRTLFHENGMIANAIDFIRDPDDPTFHPVRDVLERNVSTQLRKIAFSALVYGALVIVCLGGVIWGISLTIRDVFPIHWSSNEPILEFPVDLLVYNFLMPVAVRFFRPSKGLRKMYGWWFKKCARMLRLTEFLFKERKEDEEGHHVNLSVWRLLFGNRGQPGQPEQSTSEDSQHDLTGNYSKDQLVPDGTYVRAPASDQVRIPKGTPTFLEVDKDNHRVDGLPDASNGSHGYENPMFSKVYIPPLFRLRISAFILLIWIFAATTGVGFTVVPLIFGRYVFAKLIPNHLRMNDVYAFSIGIYLLGGPVYLVIQYFDMIANFTRNLRQSMQSSNSTYASTARKVMDCSLKYLLHTFRLLYFYTSFSLLLPSLFALFMELYLVIPLHTYFSASATDVAERHTIHFIQDWTLGVLYVKTVGRLILWYSASRPARALRALVAPPHGWLNPDIRLATRAFIFPTTAIMGIALIAPVGLGLLANKTLFAGQDELIRAVVYRYSYPAVLGGALMVLFAIRVAKAVEGWRLRVRDEVYLIGERLHNFGEKRGKVSRGRRIRTGP